MSHGVIECVTIAILAKAPIPGLVKTRLIPALGAEGAARLQAELIERTVATAARAALGLVTLWTAPDETHPLFSAMRARHGVTLARQCDGDIGARMSQAAVAANAPVLIVGTDCPAFNPDHLHRAAALLRDHDIVVIPAEDGGYVLIGMRQPRPALFNDIAWSTATVMDETRRRLGALKLTWHELPALWDVDRPEDFERMRCEITTPPAEASAQPR